VLVVTRLDRLARSTRDLLNVIAAIAERGAGLMLTVLGGLAEFERELIRARTGEGRKRAKERGSGEGLKLPAEVFPYQQTWQDTVVDARQ
jgi:DNA invertase Pin-like site-specific DNA recombinase